jgi:hypothetical protein
MTPLLDLLTRATHAMWSLLPQSVLALDRVRFHHTRTPQTYQEMFVTLGLYTGSVVVLTTVVDLAVCRPLTRWWMRRQTRETPPKRAVKKTGWFLLHSIFNTMIIGVSYREAWEAFRDPARGGYSPSHWSGTHPASLFGAIAIGGFHTHHLIAYRDSLTSEDVIHHLTNAGAVVIIGALCPWGRFTALSNTAMCGFPGAVNYALLWAQASKRKQKSVNRVMNIVVRYPVQLLSVYAVFLAHASGNAPRVDAPMAAMMVLGMTAHTINALYYADLVVGNYHVDRERARLPQRE